MSAIIAHQAGVRLYAARARRRGGEPSRAYLSTVYLRSAFASGHLGWCSAEQPMAVFVCGLVMTFEMLVPNGRAVLFVPYCASAPNVLNVTRAFTFLVPKFQM